MKNVTFQTPVATPVVQTEQIILEEEIVLPDTSDNAKKIRDFLSEHEWPVGLQDTLLENLKKCPARFFICDNSGSMSIPDGKRIVVRNNSKTLEQCSRWDELQGSLEFMAQLATISGSFAEFRLMNNFPPIQVGNEEDLKVFKSYLARPPSGSTPLCFHINRIAKKIRSIEHSLRANGQKVAVIIATDGIASDGDITGPFRALQNLPVWIVLRICTDEERVVDYWNGIDQQFDLDMDVLDDVWGEAYEIRKYNPWLTYGEQLHMIREFGIAVKAFDLIDETKLTFEDTREICSLM